jgi:hypothetical protein
MANERVDGREQVGEAIGVLFAASRDSVVWAARSAGEIQIDSIAISRKVASSVVKSVGEVAVEAFDVWEQATKKALQTSRALGQEVGATVRLLVHDLPVGVIEVVRHVLASASDAVKGGIREAADIGTTAAASVSRVAHESTQATQRVAGDVTGAARAGIGGAIEVSRAAGATGVRAAREVLGGLIDGARGIGNIRPLRLRVAAAPSSPRSVAGRGRRRAASEGAAS